MSIPYVLIFSSVEVLWGRANAANIKATLKKRRRGKTGINSPFQEL
jgi:hypothetical protein